MNYRKIFIAIGVATWAVLFGVGFVWLTDYSTRPSISANVSPTLPAGVFSAENRTTPRLVVFLHPKCPCSRATLNELARMVARFSRPVDIEVVFYKPDSEPLTWIEGDLFRSANIIPNVSISTMDETDLERFGVVTSGQTIVYDTLNRAVFSGGITVSRGHEGKSLGRTAVESILSGEEPIVRETPVFGCLLTSRSRTF